MIKKPKKKKNQTIHYWQTKADKLMQETGRQMYKKCIVCGSPMVCMHHIYPKSQSTYLRYNWKNLVPVCHKCHMAHHNGDPEIHVRIIKTKGQDWFDDLTAERNKNRYVNAGYAYYRDIYEKLKLLKPYKA